MSAKKKKKAGKAGQASKRAKVQKRAKAPKRAKVAARAKVKAPKGRAVAKKVAAKKKPAAKKLVAKKATSTKSATAMKRRDATGHLDPKYAADLRARTRERATDDNRAFLGKKGKGDALSRELGKEFVETVTSGEDEGNEVRDQRVTEELGGPFTVSTGGAEYANDVDGSNPRGATREPFPRT
jgi:hypothetical protein